MRSSCCMHACARRFERAGFVAVACAAGLPPPAIISRLTHAIPAKPEPRFGSMHAHAARARIPGVSRPPRPRVRVLPAGGGGDPGAGAPGRLRGAACGALRCPITRPCAFLHRMIGLPPSALAPPSLPPPRLVIARPHTHRTSGPCPSRPPPPHPLTPTPYSPLPPPVLSCPCPCLCCRLTCRWSSGCSSLPSAAPMTWVRFCGACLGAGAGYPCWWWWLAKLPLGPSPVETWRPQGHMCNTTCAHCTAPSAALDGRRVPAPGWLSSGCAASPLARCPPTHPPAGRTPTANPCPPPQPPHCGACPRRPSTRLSVTTWRW